MTPPADGAFAGKVAVITGASRGIGRALAVRLAAAGARIVVGYRRSAEAAAEVAAACGNGAFAAAVELEEPAAIDALFDRIAAECGRVDAFVANAAASAFKPVDELRAHHLDRSYAANVRAFVLCAQRAVAHQRGGGRIVAVTSYGSARVFPYYAALGSAKAAIESWVRYLAVAYAARRITVNAVNGGIFETDSSAYYYALPGLPSLESVAAQIPARRVGTAGEIAATIAFLLGDDAAYITGQTIVVDGGLSIVAPPLP